MGVQGVVLPLDRAHPSLIFLVSLTKNSSLHDVSLALSILCRAHRRERALVALYHRYT